MPSYYPSQGSYSHHPQPVVYSTSSHGHGHGRQRYNSSADYYSPPAGQVVYVPTHNSSRHGHGHRRHHRSHSTPPAVASSAGVVMQPSYHGSHSHHDHGHGHHRYPSLGERIRRFFGLAPRSNVKYKSNNSNWGFLGHSRRQRYVDTRNGAEVDRHGRPIYRV